MSDKVCHHEDCQEINNGNPLLLCLRCDEVHHLGAGSNHARFDVPGEIAIFFGIKILFAILMFVYMVFIRNTCSWEKLMFVHQDNS